MASVESPVRASKHPTVKIEGTALCPYARIAFLEVEEQGVASQMEITEAARKDDHGSGGVLGRSSLRQLTLACGSTRSRSGRNHRRLRREEALEEGNRSRSGRGTQDPGTMYRSCL